MLETIIGASMFLGKPATSIDLYRIDPPRTAEVGVRNDTGFSFPQVRKQSSTMASDSNAFESAIAERASRLEQLNETLDSLKLFDSGWDGYSAERPSETAIEEAKILLSRTPFFIPLPALTLTSSGEILLYWKKDQAYAEAGLSGDGSYYYFLDGQAGAEGLPVSQGFTKQFANSLLIAHF